MSKIKETLKEKAAVAQAEIKEAMQTTKANIKAATAVALHPFDREKKAEAKEEAAQIKDDATQEKLARVDEAHHKKEQATGAVAGTEHAHAPVMASGESTSSSSSESDTSETREEPGPAAVKPTPSPTEPVFMVNR